MLDSDSEALGDPVYLALQPRIVERNELAALLADQVVMVLPARVDRLEAGLTLADRHALDQSVLDEQLQHAIDARAAYRRALGAQLVLDLHGAEGAGLARQQFDDPLPCPTALMPGAGENRVHVLGPCGCVGLRHAIQD